jgi:hypothetical protein
MLAEIFWRGIPAMTPTTIEVIRSAINALSLNFSTIINNSVTPTTTIKIIYVADIEQKFRV